MGVALSGCGGDKELGGGGVHVSARVSERTTRVCTLGVTTCVCTLGVTTCVYTWDKRKYPSMTGGSVVEDGAVGIRAPGPVGVSGG